MAPRVSVAGGVIGLILMTLDSGGTHIGEFLAVGWWVKWCVFFGKMVFERCLFSTRLIAIGWFSWHYLLVICFDFLLTM